ncbi:hypothetical protein [Staphylococcus agnetis]|uniref:PIN domain-containing protein n=1 Tax=Staphylococcus agnetis TaxID=985762 RepID=A0AAW9YUI2_9STAP|nr:hypothetical protein [Staphylococcus agnetis]NJI02199.1 hypothetical protein [Staphylococcus agnetis]
MNDIKCVCDANIWIDACHCDAEVDYLNEYSVVGFAEQVHNEIVKFQNAKDKFSYIYNKYVTNQNSYEVLKTNILGDMETHFRYELSLKGFADIDNSQKAIKNLGEYASLYFAYYLKIPLIHSTDLDFIQQEKERMPDIEIITWNEICEKISYDDNDRLKKNKIIEKKKQEMNKNKQEIVNSKKQFLEKRLEKLESVTNAKRNK